MNNYLKIAIGAGIGAGVGWFIGSVIVEYIDIMEERRNEDFIDAFVVEDEGVNETEENQRPSEMSKHKHTKRERTVDYAKAFIPNESDKPELAELVARYNHGILPSDEPAAPPENEEAWEDEDDNSDSGPIRIIHVAEYANSDSGYEQITLLYFDDDVVTDNNRKVLKDPESFIGEEALISFGVLSEKEDTVYIRNDDRRQEYEVVRMDEPFILTPEPVNRKPSRFDHVQEEEDEGESS